MTREEAIEILEKHHMWTGEPQELIEVRKENEALAMAISALSENKGDLISRERLINEWDDLGRRYAMPTTPIHKRAFKEFPSADVRENRWIPVSERLPEKNDVYLVAIETLGYPRRDVDGFIGQTPRKWEHYGDKVVAWMPLPEPYKAERGEQNE